MVKKYLSKEIKKSLIKYVNNINSMFAAKSSTNNNQYYQVLLSGCINNISEFTINKYSINDINNNIAIKNNNRVITDFNKNRLKILCFIWFLNDYDGEIVFWNNPAGKADAGEEQRRPLHQRAERGLREELAEHHLPAADGKGLEQIHRH